MAGKNGAAEEIEEKVNDSINKGFTPVGGLSVARNGDTTYFYQAMVNFQHDPIL